jgi:hypothetical protein
MATAALPQREIIRFEYGRTETVCLKFATGKEVQGRGGPQFMFTTVDDRIFFVDHDIAYNIEHCGAPLGEPIMITRTKGPRNTVNWDVRPVNAVPKPAPAPAPVSSGPDLTEKLELSIARVQAAKTAAAEPPKSIPDLFGEMLAACGIAAIQATSLMEGYARENGLTLRFDAGAIERMAVSLFISWDRRSSR